MGATNQTLKVLVMESDIRCLHALKIFFHELSATQNTIEATFCSEASSAIRHVEENRYDLLLIDNDMPGLPTIEFLYFIFAESGGRCREASKVIRIPANKHIEQEQLDAFVHCDEIINKHTSLFELEAFSSYKN